MAEINPVGIDLITGQMRPLTLDDGPTNNIGTVLNAYTGLQGVTGSQGATGAASPQGTTGIRAIGVQGITGVRGLTGLAGEVTGLTGTTGIRGLTGIRGATGAQGATGIQGATGTQGLPGNFSILFGATTITADQNLIGITGGGFTVTLPLASNAGNRRYVIQDQSGNAASNNTTVSRSGSDDIVTLAGPAASVLLQDNYEELEIQSNGVSAYYVFRFKRGLTGIQGATGLTGATGLIGATGTQGETGI